MYILKNLPYTASIMMNESTVTSSPPSNVTAHRGMASRKPTSSMASTISPGSAAGAADAKPTVSIMSPMSPCTTSRNAIMSSSP